MHQGQMELNGLASIYLTLDIPAINISVMKEPWNKGHNGKYYQIY